MYIRNGGLRFRPATHAGRRAEPAKEAVFGGDQTHGISQEDFSELISTSEALGWRSVFVSRQIENPYRRSFPACGNPLVSFVLNGPVVFSRTIDGITQEKKFLSGSFGIVPAGTRFEVRNERRFASLHIYVKQALIEEIAAESAHGDPSRVRILPRFAMLDQLLEQLAVALCEAAENPLASSALYADQLARAFAARLIYKHSTLAVSEIPATQGLDPKHLRLVKDYIEANLASTLSLADMARQCNLSPNHFSRLFKRATDLTPYQYVLRRRMERAQRLLSETDLPIAQIALDCGFGNQVHLTQTFKRFIGLSPASFRSRHA